MVIQCLPSYAAEFRTNIREFFYAPDDCHPMDNYHLIKPMENEMVMPCVISSKCSPKVENPKGYKLQLPISPTLS